LGVDFLSTEIALHSLLKKEKNPGEYLDLVLPTWRGLYMERLSRVSMEEDDVIRTQVDGLINQLRYIERNWPEAIFDDYPSGHIDKDKFLDSNDREYIDLVYFNRNGLISYGADAFIGFSVNGSKGTNDMIDRVESLDKPLLVQKYKMDVSDAERGLKKVDYLNGTSNDLAH